MEVPVQNIELTKQNIYNSIRYYDRIHEKYRNAKELFDGLLHYLFFLYSLSDCQWTRITITLVAPACEFLIISYAQNSTNEISVHSKTPMDWCSKGKNSYDFLFQEPKQRLGNETFQHAQYS